AEQRLDVGDVLGRTAAGGDRQAHRVERAGQVAVQLAQVGDARVGGQVGLQVDHALQRARGGAVAAELDLGVDDDAERAGQAGGDAVGREPVAEAAEEVVAGEREGA